MQMYASSKFGIVPLVRDVEGRSGILFHAANDALKELRGCIAPVTRITDWGRGNESKKALTEVIKIVKHTEETNGECWIDITSRKGYPVIV